MATASFLGFDTTTLGSWTIAYGANGRGIANDGATTPVGATITITVGTAYTWDSAPTSARALLRLTPTSRIASAWYDATAVKLTATGTTGTQRLHLYLCDWDSNGRAATVNVYDNGTNALLDTRTVNTSTYIAGVWLSWDFTGDIRVEAVRTAGGNAVINGWFLGDDPGFSGGDARLSQLPIEALRTSEIPSLRLSQVPVEILRGDQPIPSLRLSQVPVEVLRGNQPIPSLRLSQLPIEVLRGLAVTKPHVSTVVVETLSIPTPAVRDSQLAVEVLSELPAAPPRVTQVATETLSQPPSAPARVTELAVELLHIDTASLPSPPARVSQTIVEILQSEVAADLVVGGTIGGFAQVFAPTVVIGTRISQTTIEVLQASLPRTSLSQVAVETLLLEPPAPPVPPTGSMLAKYLTFTKQSGTGVQTITGVGFPGKALIIWSSRLNANGTSSGAQQHAGLTDGVLQSARFIQHPGGEVESTSAQAERRDCIVLMTNATSGAGLTFQVKGVWTSWTEDGFTIDWVVNDGAPTQFHVLVIGGDDVQLVLKQVKVTTVGANTTQDVEGVGFRPDSFIVLGGASDEASVPGSESGTGDYALGAPFGSMHGFGFSNAVENICSWTLGVVVGGGTDSFRGLHTNRVASIRTANFASFEELTGLQITATHEDGFTLTRKDSITHIFPVQHILCIKGTAFKFGTFNSPATTGSLTIPLDFQAGLLLLQTHGSGTLNTAITGLGLMMGAWVVNSPQGGTWIGGEHGVSPTVFGRSSYSNRIIEVRRPDTLAVTCAASLASSDLTGLRLDFTEVPATPITFLYLALGAILSPEEPETIFNPDDIAIVGLTWVEFTDSNHVLHVWAGIALPDPQTYYGGYKAPIVIEWDPIRRGLSNIDGAYEGIAWSWLMSDTDRAIRRMLANELTKWFFNRNVVGRTITDPGRRALETPRTIFRGVVREWQPMAQGLFSFAAEDYLVTTFQIGTDEQQCPKRKLEALDFPTCPEENIGRPVPIVYGNMSDKNEIVHIVPGTPGTASTVGLKKPTNLTATVHGGAGSSSYTYGVTALDNRNKQYNVYAKNTDHAGETDAAYVTVTNAPSLSQMSSTRYVELNWTDSVGAYFYRIYGRAVNGGTSLNLLDSARGPGAGSPERYNDGERHGYTEVDREKTNSHPPKSNNTVVAGTPDVPESSYITDSGRGVVPVVHVGQREIGGAPWYEFLVCGHAIKAITAVYQADADQTFQPKEQTVIPIHESLETDAGVKSVAPITALGGIRIPDSECNVGGSLLVPTLGTGWAAAIGAPVYRDYNGHRYTVIYARNVIGETAALGEQPLFLNVAGIETTGDGTGTLITSLIDQYLHVMQNWLIGDYQSLGWLASPTFPDETTLPQLDAASFTKAKAISEQRIAGGYVGATQFGLDGTFMSLRDAIAQMNVSADVNSGFNYRTQFIVSMQSEEISSLGTAQSVTQTRDIIRDTFNIESLVSEFFNRIPFLYGILPENGTGIFYTEVKDPRSIEASLETRSSPTRYLPFVRNAPIAFDIARRFLLRSKDVPRKVTWEMGMAGLNFELGDIVLVTHIDGIGLNGYEATPVRVTRQDYNPQNYTVSIEGYDVGQFFSDSFILGNEGSLSSSWATATLAERGYGYLGDETTGAFNDGARAKRLR